MFRNIINRFGIKNIEKYQSRVIVEYTVTMKIRGNYHKIKCDNHQEYFSIINELERNGIRRFGDSARSYLNREID